MCIWSITGLYIVQVSSGDCVIMGHSDICNDIKCLGDRDES